MMQQNDGKTGGHGIFFLKTASSIGLAIVAAATMHYGTRHHRKRQMRCQKIIPHFMKSGSGHFDRIERFSHYVARQIGFEDPNEVSQLCKLANNYLKKTKGCEENIYEYLCSDLEAESESLFKKLIDEFDRCIIGYFAFHWSQTSAMITQVLRDDSEESESKRKLKNILMAATRKQRFDRVIKDLKVTSSFSTLVTEMKAIGITSNDDSYSKDVMVPAVLSERSPVLLLMGGGTGVGKSTVIKDILKEPFWVEAAEKAVVVDSDAFKETDIIYRSLSSKDPHDMLQTAELVHQSSTNAASSLLVTALNEGRDVILDGTLSWEPFFEQTISMARNVHHHRYRMGVGYKVVEDGSVIENYWEQVEDEEENQEQKEAAPKRKPYRIELVGVVCDPHLAVVRGVRRAILVGRAVRVNWQLKSHKRFANAFQKYCQLVDSARLYSTNSLGGPPKLIGWKDGESNLLVDLQEIHCLETVSKLNADAESIEELYKNLDQTDKANLAWEDILLSPSRAHLQHELKIAIQKAENQR
ncbi:hypothetical protein NE237_016002 [Protea cynaroides]|uniref:Zeta toxin domain-containing protein n=1 Tax=Protea cynaroides TaxID=273540 RepID=A0A9Q0KFB1_9MAGN|nr:hypothetical protein NE237_016002 [Protea cynaroides]